MFICQFIITIIVKRYVKCIVSLELQMNGLRAVKQFRFYLPQTLAKLQQICDAFLN